MTGDADAEQETGAAEDRDVEVPEKLDWDNLDQYSEAEIEAYNEQRRDEIQTAEEKFNEQQEEAVDRLRESAQQSLETEEVELDSGLELEVRARIPPEVEDMQEELDQAVATGDIALARRLAAAMNATMVESPDEYADTDVWLVASRDGDAGIQWLVETSQKLTEPAEDRMPDNDEGNEKQSNDLPGRNAGKQSGWQRQR